jgi:hypothetical protein
MSPNIGNERPTVEDPLINYQGVEKLFYRHSRSFYRESSFSKIKSLWIPASAGMTILRANKFFLNSC